MGEIKRTWFAFTLDPTDNGVILLGMEATATTTDGASKMSNYLTTAERMHLEAHDRINDGLRRTLEILREQAADEPVLWECPNCGSDCGAECSAYANGSISYA